MTDERMNEELAIIDGVDLEEKVHRHSTAPRLRGLITINPISPNYLEDANATKRIVRGMGVILIRAYMRILDGIIVRDYKGEDDHDIFIPQATVRQEAEAILKANGTWEEDDDMPELQR